MNPRHLTRTTLFAASKRLGSVRVPGHRRVFKHVHRANNSVIRPVHTVTNTYETNRDVLTSKQNKLTTGPNANSIVSQYDYTVNAMGQRVLRTQSGTAFDGIGYAPGTQLPSTMTSVAGSGTSTDVFNYNTRGEVENSTNNLASNFNRSYSYDPIGNRLAATEGDPSTPSTNPNAKTYTTNALNQYTQINTQITTTPPAPPTTAQPTYDADGNMLTDGTGNVYTWDCENRLIQVTLPNSEIVKYYYDFGSHRIKREHLTPTTTTNTLYFYDDWNVIEEKTTIAATGDSAPEVFTTTTSTTTIYHWGLDLSTTHQGAGGVGGLLCSKTINDAIHRNYLYDANGNVCELLDMNGSIYVHYCYDSFGKEYLGIGVFSEINTFRFSTKQSDNIAGLSYYGYRFYFPKCGRWINRDSIEEIGGLNIYAFNKNDASNFVDTNGLTTFFLFPPFPPLLPPHWADPPGAGRRPTPPSPKTSSFSLKTVKKLGTPLAVPCDSEGYYKTVQETVMGINISADLEKKIKAAGKGLLLEVESATNIRIGASVKYEIRSGEESKITIKGPSYGKDCYCIYNQVDILEINLLGETLIWPIKTYVGADPIFIKKVGKKGQCPICPSEPATPET